MKQLLSNYKLEHIILFVVLTAIAIKELISVIDWYRKRARQSIEDKDKPLATAQKNKEEIEGLKKKIHHIKDQIDILVASDRDTIRHSITKDHHYFCYKLKCIDDFSLQCIERQYANYKTEGGNTFIDQLMEQIRALPRRLEQNNR